jgi:hypothetical protein
VTALPCFYIQQKGAMMVQDAHRPARACPVSFSLGLLVSTPNALIRLFPDEIRTAIKRHSCGDWGDLNNDDWQANESALVEQSRLFSVYHSASREKFYVITEADRSVTTVLLPEDY